MKIQQQLNHRFVNLCFDNTCSFRGELEIFYCLPLLALSHRSFDCFEEGDGLISSWIDFMLQHIDTKRPSAFAVNGVALVMYYRYR